jgi:hypothetical protein
LLTEARKKGMTLKNIKSVFRTTENWPISYVKALLHPEINPDKEKHRAKSSELEDDDTIKSGHDIMDLAGPNTCSGDH